MTRRGAHFVTGSSASCKLPGNWPPTSCLRANPFGIGQSRAGHQKAKLVSTWADSTLQIEVLGFDFSLLLLFEVCMTIKSGCQSGIRANQSIPTDAVSRASLPMMARFWRHATRIKPKATISL